MQILRQEREAGLHLWYTVKFNKGTDLKAAAERLKQLGEISKVQTNGRIKRAYNTDSKRIYLSDKALQQKSTRSAAEGEPNDPALPASGITVTWVRTTMTLRSSIIIRWVLRQDVT